LPNKPGTSSAEASALTKNDALGIPGFHASAIFQSMNAALMSKSKAEIQKIVAETNAIFQFEIKNGFSMLQTWSIDLKHMPAQVTLGSHAQPDIIVQLQDDDFVLLARGKLTGQKAFMSGKLKLKGNMMLAMKLETLLTSLRQQPMAKL
jgi:putative sterol carrier protein